MVNAYFSEEDNFFYIKDEEGNEEKFELLYEFDDEEKGETYVLLVPPEELERYDSNDEDLEPEVEVYVLKHKLGEENPEYTILESDEEWDKIEEVLETLAQLEEEAESEGENFK